MAIPDPNPDDTERPSSDGTSAAVDAHQWTVDNLVPSPREFIDSLTEQNYPFGTDYLGLSKLSYWLMIYAKALLADNERLTTALAEAERRAAALEVENAALRKLVPGAGWQSHMGVGG